MQKKILRKNLQNTTNGIILCIVKNRFTGGAYVTKGNPFRIKKSFEGLQAYESQN